MLYVDTSTKLGALFQGKNKEAGIGMAVRQATSAIVTNGYLGTKQSPTLE